MKSFRKQWSKDLSKLSWRITYTGQSRLSWRITHIANSTQKKPACYTGLGNGKLRQRQAGTAGRFIWPGSEHQQHQILPKMWSDRSPHLLLMGMENCAGTWEGSVTVPCTAKQTLSMNQRIAWHLSKLAENKCSHKNLHIAVHRHITHNSWNLKSPRLIWGWVEN